MLKNSDQPKTNSTKQKEEKGSRVVALTMWLTTNRDKIAVTPAKKLPKLFKLETGFDLSLQTIRRVCEQAGVPYKKLRSARDPVVNSTAASRRLAMEVRRLFLLAGMPEEELAILDRYIRGQAVIPERHDLVEENATAKNGEATDRGLWGEEDDQ